MGLISIIIIGEEKSSDLPNDKYKLAIKIIPIYIQTNVRIKPNIEQLEIAFYWFFTKRYLLTNRTPHLVGIYNNQKCNNLKKLLGSLIPSKKSCPTYEDILTKKNLKLDYNETILCDLLLRIEFKMFDNIYQYAMLEYCQGSLPRVITEWMRIIKKSNGKKLDNLVKTFVEFLNRIFFQIIFTLAIIKDDYPGFLHGDFFIRNILYVEYNNYNLNDYVAYHYKDHIFYLPANGIYTKIGDFGYTIIANELQPNIYDYNSTFIKMFHLNPFNKKTDIFNFFHDIYDGQNLGTNSINLLMSYIPCSTQIK